MWFFNYFMALVVAIFAFQGLMCLYVMSNPAAVAGEIAKPARSYLAWFYLTALQLGRDDPEMDLVQSGLPFDAVVANCRRRAVMGLGFSALAIVISLAYAALHGVRA